jgi:hypothetical protein
MEAGLDMHLSLQSSMTLWSQHWSRIQSDQFELLYRYRHAVGTFIFPSLLKMCQLCFFRYESSDFSMGVNLTLKRSLIALPGCKVPGSIHMEDPVRAAEVAFFFVVVLSHGNL